MITQARTDCDHQKNKTCGNIKIVVTEYDNSTVAVTNGLCGTSSASWLTATGSGIPAVYTNWSLDYGDSEAITNNTFTVTSSGGAGWNENFTLTIPELNSFHSSLINTNGVWDWFNKGAPCYRFWSLVSCGDVSIPYGKMSVTITRGNLVRDVVMTPNVREEIVEFFIVDCGDCKESNISYEDLQGNEITSFSQYLSNQTGIPLAQIEQSLSEQDLIDCIKLCGHEYTSSEVESLDCQGYITLLCDISPPDGVQEFYRTATVCVLENEVVSTTIEDTLEDPRITDPSDLTLYEVVGELGSCGEEISSTILCDDCGNSIEVVVYDDGTILHYEYSKKEGRGELTFPSGILGKCPEPERQIYTEEYCFDGYEYFYDNTTPSNGACGFVSANYGLNPNETTWVSFENSCDIYDAFTGHTNSASNLNGYFDDMNTYLTDNTPDTWEWSLDVPNKCWRYFTTISKEQCYGIWTLEYKGKIVTVVPRIKYSSCSITKKVCEYKTDSGEIVIESTTWFDNQGVEITDLQQWLKDCTDFNPLTIEKVFDTDEKIIDCLTTDCSYKGITPIEDPCIYGQELLCAESDGNGESLTLFWSRCNGVYSQEIYTTVSLNNDPTGWVEWTGEFANCDGSPFEPPLDCNYTIIPGCDIVVADPEITEEEFTKTPVLLIYGICEDGTTTRGYYEEDGETLYNEGKGLLGYFGDCINCDFIEPIPTAIDFEESKVCGLLNQKGMAGTPKRAYRRSYYDGSAHTVLYFDINTDAALFDYHEYCCDDCIQVFGCRDGRLAFPFGSTVELTNGDTLDISGLRYLQVAQLVVDTYGGTFQAPSLGGSIGANFSGCQGISQHEIQFYNVPVEILSISEMDNYGKFGTCEFQSCDVLGREACVKYPDTEGGCLNVYQYIDKCTKQIVCVQLVDGIDVTQLLEDCGIELEYINCGCGCDDIIQEPECPTINFDTDVVYTNDVIDRSDPDNPITLHESGDIVSFPLKSGANFINDFTHCINMDQSCCLLNVNQTLPITLRYTFDHKINAWSKSHTGFNVNPGNGTIVNKWNPTYTAATIGGPNGVREIRWIDVEYKLGDLLNAESCITTGALGTSNTTDLSNPFPPEAYETIYSYSVSISPDFLEQYTNILSLCPCNEEKTEDGKLLEKFNISPTIEDSKLNGGVPEGTSEREMLSRLTSLEKLYDKNIRKAEKNFRKGLLLSKSIKKEEPAKDGTKEETKRN